MFIYRKGAATLRQDGGRAVSVRDRVTGARCACSKRGHFYKNKDGKAKSQLLILQDSEL